MGLIERFVAGVTAAIAAIGNPAEIGNRPNPPAVVHTGAPTTEPPLPIPRPDPALLLAAVDPVLPLAPADAPPPAGEALAVAEIAPVPAGDPEGPEHAPVPANDYGVMLAALGQAPGDALFFAPPTEAIDTTGAGAAIDMLLRGGGFAGVEAGLERAAAPATPIIPLPRPDRMIAALPANTGPGLPEAAPQLDEACVTRLAGLEVVATPLPPLDDTGACGITTPIQIAMIGAGRGGVEFTPDAMVDCSVAGALRTWLEDDVQPAATRLLGQQVTGVRVASAYACRGRNNDPTAALSEHAFGRAIDISAFQLADGTWLTVQPYATDATATATEQFLAEVRQDACGPFTTVLGPGVAYHDDHFHLDLAQRGNYCR
ncbi:MAG: extensin family protein [Bauldia sp.]